jgi:hypothetical protein
MLEASSSLGLNEKRIATRAYQSLDLKPETGATSAQDAESRTYVRLSSR